MAVLALMAAGCGKKSSSSTGTTEPGLANGTNITVADPGAPQAGGTLKVGLNAETDGWSPIKNQWAGSAYIVAGAIFDHLAEYDANGVAQPYLARVPHAERRLHRVDDQAAAQRDVPQRREVRRRRAQQELRGAAGLDPHRAGVRERDQDRDRRRPHRQADHEAAVVDVPRHHDHPARGHRRAGHDRRPRRWGPRADRHRALLLRGLDARQQARRQEEPGRTGARATRCSTASSSRCCPT